MKSLDDTECKVIARVQGDLSVGKRLFDPPAKDLGMEPLELIERIKALKGQGIIREVKAVLRHRDAGFSSGAMVAWAVQDERIEEVGNELASRRSVSHCYERPGFGGFTLFSMIHGRSDEEVTGVIEEIAQSLKLDRYKVYRSVRELKKSSMQYAVEDLS